MGVPFVNTFMGGDSTKDLDDNWEEALRVWPDIVAFAKDHGVKLTIENCPMIFQLRRVAGRQQHRLVALHLAAHPRAVGRHDRAQLRPVAPGLADDRPRAASSASSGRTSSTSRRRTCRSTATGSTSAARSRRAWAGRSAPARPGRRRLGASSRNLYRVGYDGDCIIEHEDRDFEGTDELVKRGFLLARDILRPYIQGFDAMTDPTSSIDADLPRRRQDDRPLAAPARARRRVHRGRLPAGRRVRRGVGLRPPGRRRPAAEILRGTDVKVGTVVGFPHGNVLTETKVFETRQALERGRDRDRHGAQHRGAQVRPRRGRRADIAAVVDVAHAAGAIVKVIFENAYLTDDEKIRACHADRGGRRRLRQDVDRLRATGATHEDLRLMRANTSPHMQVKAAGGVRTLDALLEVMALGVTRIGATATKTILDDFTARKAGPTALRAGAPVAIPTPRNGRRR